MEPLSALLVVGAMAFGVGMALYTQKVFFRRLVASWRQVAHRLGLVVEEESQANFGSPNLRARRGPLVVELQRELRGKISGTLLTISGLGYSPQGLTVKQEGVGAWIGKKLGFEDIQLGAAADSELVIAGDEVLAQAVLDADTRAELIRFLTDWPGGAKGWGGRSLETSFGDGVLSVWMRHSRLRSEQELTDQLHGTLEPLLRLADRLSAPKDLVARLAERILPGDGYEPEAGARLKCLRLLLREAPQNAATLAAARAGLSDENDEFRFEAARALGAAGVPTLLALAEGQATRDAVAARAVSTLADRLPANKAAAIFRRALATGRSEVAVAALDSLTRFAAWQAETEALEGLAGALPAVAVAAARALARVGTVAAVPELAAAESRGPREVAEAARQAIAEIQARLKGAEHGQLSLSAAAAGALSLSEGREPGRLSLFSAPAEPELEEEAVPRPAERIGVHE